MNCLELRTHKLHAWGQLWKPVNVFFCIFNQKYGWSVGIDYLRSLKFASLMLCQPSCAVMSVRGCDILKL